LTFLIIGFSVKSKSGEFAIQSQTAGGNLIIVANDKASGRYMDLTSKNGVAFISNKNKYSWTQQDSILMKRSLNWICSHKEIYAKSYLKRFIHFFYLGKEPWADNFDSKIRWLMWLHNNSSVPSIEIMQQLLKSGQISRIDYLLNTKKINRIIKPTIFENIYLYTNNKIIKSMVYDLMILVFILTLLFHRQYWISSKGILIIFVLLYAGASALFPIEPRYVYPMTFALTLISAAAIYKFVKAVSR
jgi:hypothetical protein